MNTVIVLNHDQMGLGDSELGRKILGTFLGKVPSIQEVSTIALYNSGVKLLAKGSPVLAELTMLEENGVDLLPCGTCVNHYGVELATGEISTMDQIVQELNKAEKVITL
ncbi:MAG: DsrE family protein [Planctomycetes bacterium]|nr:DsrE family protein [Planctomycetota bacterium]